MRARRRRRAVCAAPRQPADLRMPRVRRARRPGARADPLRWHSYLPDGTRIPAPLPPS